MAKLDIIITRRRIPADAAAELRELLKSGAGSAAFGSSAKLEAHTFTGNQPLLPRKAHARAHEGTRGHDVAGGKARGVKRVHNLPFVRLKSSANRSNAD